MTTFILFFIGYFFLTFTLSRIAEKEEIDGDGIAGFLLLIPPLYFLYITHRFRIMLIITGFTYLIANFLVVYLGIPAKFALALFIIPVLIGFAYILHNLKLDQKLNLLNFFPPVIGSILLLFYLGFISKEEEKKNLYEGRINKTLKEVDNKNAFKSEFESLNKNLFKSFDKIDYNKVDNDSYFGVN